MPRPLRSLRWLLASLALLSAMPAWAAMSISPSPSYSGSFTVSWTSAYFSNYRFKENGVILADPPNGATSKAFSGKTPGTYTYVIQEEDGETPGIWFPLHGPVSVTVQNPNVPGGVSASVSSPNYNGNYTISWNSATGASTYELQERADGGTWATAQNTSTRNKAFAKTSPALYEYRVRSVNGSLTSAWSSPLVSVNVQVPPNPTDTPTATFSATKSFTVNWLAATGAATYTLKERQVLPTPTSWIDYANVSGTSKSFSNKSPNGTYEYKVKVCNNPGCSGAGGIASLVVPNPLGVPVPNSISSPDYDGGYSVSWSTDTLANHYEIDESINGTTNWSGAVNVPTGTSWSYSGKTPATYYYRVRSIGEGGEIGNWSSTYASVVISPPSAPTTPSVSNLNSGTGSYTVGWAHPTGATPGTTVYQLDEQVGATGVWTQIQSSTAITKLFSNVTNGTRNYRVRACNNTGPGCSGNSSSVSATIANQSPVISPIAATAASHKLVFSYDVEASDAEGNTLTWSLAQAPAGMTINSGSGLISWISPVVGTHSVTVQVTDPISIATPGQQGFTLTVETDATNRGDVSGLLRYGTNTTGNEPGLTPTQVDVSPSGAATVAIPISVPPGTADMQPTLSLSYSSGGGNGIAGLGWNLVGISVITRCAQTLAQDGTIDPVDYDTNDQFCLEGQRLIPISGINGAEGTVYRTEADQFTKVISYGTTGSGPTYFKAWTKSGHVMEYGFDDTTRHSRIQAQGKIDVAVWALDKLSDTSGNYLTITYEESATNDEFRPTRIDYAGNTRQPTSPYASVQFVYEDRTDLSKQFVGGARVKLTKRLKNIQTFFGSTLVRDYQLAYDYGAAGGASRLINVTECDGGGAAAKCLAPTEFTYENPPATGALFQTQENIQAAYQMLPAYWRGDRVNLHTGDFNGDGRTDILLQQANAAITEGTSLLIAINFGDFNNRVALTTQYGMTAALWAADEHIVHTGDFNGDGMTDLLLQQKGAATNSYLLLANGNGGFQTKQNVTNTDMQGSHWNADNRALHTGDFNGDGRSDVLLQTANTNTPASYLLLANGAGFDNKIPVTDAFNMTTTKWSATERVLHTGDFNGDGMTDVLLQALDNELPENKTYLLIAKSGGVQFENVVDITAVDGMTSADWSVTGNVATSSCAHEISIGDYNGDDLDDVIVLKSAYGCTPGGQTYLLLADGSSAFFRRSDIGSLYGMSPQDWSARAIAVGDFNGDGNDDLLLQQETTTQWSPSVAITLFLFADGNGGFTGRYDATGSWGMTQDLWSSKPTISTRYQLHLLQLNANGIPDILLQSHDALYTDIPLLKSANVLPDVVTQVKSGLTAKTIISYKSLLADAVYTPGTVPAYPKQRFEAPMPVVNAVSADNGIGGQNVTNFTYQDAKVDLDGRGFLGFKTVVADDVSLGIRTTNTYKQTFPRAGLVQSSIRELISTGVRLEDFTYTYTTVDTVVGKASKFVYPQTVVHNTYDPDGTPTTPLVTTTTVNTPETFGGAAGSDNTYGNIATTAVTTVGNGETFVTHSANTYQDTSISSNASSTWFLGRLTRVDTTQYLPGNSDPKDGTCTLPGAPPPTGPLPVPTCTKRRVDYTYDINTAGNTGVLKTETVEPANPGLTLTTSYGHDNFGNRTTITVSGGTGTYAILPRTTTQSFAANGLNPVGRFLTAITTPLGFTETRGYDANSGAVTQIIAADGVTTTWEYDTFGREKKQIRPDGTTRETIRAWCTTSTCPAGGIIKVLRNESHAPASAAILDLLGREIAAATVQFDGQAVKVATQYDANGRLSQRSRPFVCGSAGSCTTPTTSLTTYAYDAVGRPQEELYANGAHRKFGYDQITVTESWVDSANQPLGRSSVKTERNGRGEGVKVTHIGAGTLGADLVTTSAYDPFGNPAQVVDPKGNVTSHGYDTRGRRTESRDPDLGKITFVVDVLGQVREQTEADGQTTIFNYDDLGRPQSRVSTEGTASWSYHPNTAVAGARGKPSVISGAEGETKTFGYDSLGRPTSVQTSIDGSNYTVSQSYAGGRLDTLTYPVSPLNATGFKARYVYNADGYLTEIRNNATNALYWKVTDQFADGQLKQSIAGNEDGSQNAVTTNWGQSSTTGLLSSIQSQSSVGGTGSLQNLSYGYNTLGEMDLRDDVLHDFKEEFVYDALGRMKTSTVTQRFPTPDVITPRNYGYDDLGNLNSKERAVGTGNAIALAYATPGLNVVRPHAPIGVTLGAGTSQTFSYDAQGNLLTGYNFTNARVQTMTWTSDNLPKTLVEGSDALSFSYDASRQRFKQVATVSGIPRTTVYVGGLYEKVTEGSTVTHVHYLKAGGRTVALYRADSTTGVMRYPLVDHLGSWTMIVDEAGTVVEETGFDPQGRRRNPDGSDIPQPAPGWESSRGYTGHEQLDEFSRIHMNGRVYDPDVGVFPSADPVQGLNRYAYVGNSPVDFTDPTGFAIVCVTGAGKDECFIVQQQNGSANNLGNKLFDAYRRTRGGGFSIIAFDVNRGVYDRRDYEPDEEFDSRCRCWTPVLKQTHDSSDSTPGFGDAGTPAPSDSYGTGGDVSLDGQASSDELSKTWANPTGEDVRDCDLHGCGEFGAPRDGHSHEGVDYESVPGQGVVAVQTGTVTSIGYVYGDDLGFRYIQIDGGDGYVSREFYVSPAPGIGEGSAVLAGQIIGISQSLEIRYPGITDHIHVEIRQNGNIQNPIELILGR